MLGGLFKRISNSRIPMAAKELKWELEEYSDKELAQVAYQATLFRLLRLELELNDAIMAPIEHSPDYCKTLYYTIEGYYLQAKQQSQKNLQIMRSTLGQDFGGQGFAESVAKCSVSGSKLLMVTAGVRVNANAYDDVQHSWKLVHDAVEKNIDFVVDLYDGSSLKQQIEEQAFRTGNSSYNFLEAILAIPKI